MRRDHTLLAVRKAEQLQETLNYIHVELLVVHHEHLALPMLDLAFLGLRGGETRVDLPELTFFIVKRVVEILQFC